MKSPNTLLPAVYRSRPLLMTGLSMLVVGMPLSLFLTSLSQFFLAGSFFLEGPFIEKFRKFFRQPAAIAISSVWLLHVIGLVWSEDIAAGLRDIRIKLPLLTLPVILAGSGALEKNQFRFILRIFVAAVMTGSLISTAVWLRWIHVPIDNVRDIFIFKISHIRFALFTCLAIVVSVLGALEAHGIKRWLHFGCACWLLAFMVMIESMTGIGIMVALGIFFGIRALFGGGRNKLAWLTLVAGVAGSLWLTWEVRSAYAEADRVYDEPIDIQALTSEGRKYYFDTTQHVFENGHRVWIYVCDPELRREWNKRSRTPYDSDNELSQPVRTCLIRYMSSKGLRKDAQGIRKLDFEEIRAVEKGIANVNYLHISGFRRRIKETAWELVQYRKGLDPNDHSLTQRLEYWTTAIEIIQHHPMTGVGTGDVQKAYDERYAENLSQLRPENRLRTHNQYLAIAVGLGIPAALFFLVMMTMLVVLPSNRNKVLLLSGWIIIMLSMITEDTLETQPGATFFAAALSLFLFSRPDRD